jgi:uncharacterized protein (DUF983 family)
MIVTVPGPPERMIPPPGGTSEREVTDDQSSSLTIILRGLGARCPRCSKGKLFDKWNVFRRQCDSCHYDFEEREGNCWFFLYSTTAALTGIFIIAILLWRPENLLVGRLVLGTASICIIVLSLPARKGIALALEYLSEQRGSRILLYDDEHEKHSHHQE